MKELAKTESQELIKNPWSKLPVVKSCFAPTLTNDEFKVFVGLGMSLGANPFTREIWAVKYGNQQASIFCGRDFYRKKAQEQSDYDGHIVNAIYANDEFSIENGQPSHKVNSFKERGSLIGAFCSVYRKGLKVPYFVTVQLSEYTKGQSTWKSMPETMIKKVAEAQALRGAYQGIFRGTYDESEQETIEASHTELPTIEQKDYAYSLLNSSAFDDEQKTVFDDELSDNGLSIDRLNSIIGELKMNQSDSPNPSMKEMQKQLDSRLKRDGND